VIRADKIKICRAFICGIRILKQWEIASSKNMFWSQDEVEKALRWGLKHPEELKR